MIPKLQHSPTKQHRQICERSSCNRWRPQQFDYPLSKQMSHHYSGPDWGFPRGDSRLDLTDLYAFPKPGDTGKSILVMNVHPSAHDYLDRENPLGPTTGEAFAPDALLPTFGSLMRTPFMTNCEIEVRRSSGPSPMRNTDCEILKSRI
jgi:hypothetical protein